MLIVLLACSPYDADFDLAQPEDLAGLATVHSVAGQMDPAFLAWVGQISGAEDGCPQVTTRDGGFDLFGGCSGSQGEWYGAASVDNMLGDYDASRPSSITFDQFGFGGESAVLLPYRVSGTLGMESACEVPESCYTFDLALTYEGEGGTYVTDFSATMEEYPEDDVLYRWTLDEGGTGAWPGVGSFGVTGWIDPVVDGAAIRAVGLLTFEGVNTLELSYPLGGVGCGYASVSGYPTGNTCTKAWTP